jgi:hypothetical protein
MFFFYDSLFFIALIIKELMFFFNTYVQFKRSKGERKHTMLTNVELLRETVGMGITKSCPHCLFLYIILPTMAVGITSSVLSFTFPKLIIIMT